VPGYPIRVFGDPVLKQRAREVEDVDAELAALVDSMYDSMYEAVGLGLAAPQIGVQRRIFTYDIGEGPTAVINPVIVETKGEFTYQEGCLSVPGLSFEIVRPKLITLQGLDVEGNEIVVEGDEQLGRVFLHEVDHLDGILLLDRLDPDVRKQALRALRERDLTAVPPHANGSPAL
jgi:peptide deformylase